MLNYHSPIKGEKSYTGLKVKEISPLMKLNLRGKSREFLSTVGKNINQIILLIKKITNIKLKNYYLTK